MQWCIAIIFTIACCAQTQTGALTGTAIDPLGNALPRASVELRSSETPTVLRQTADLQGRFEFVGVQPGIYSLKISMPGFATRELADLRVRPGERRSLPAIPLTLGMCGNRSVPIKLLAPNDGLGRIVIKLTDEASRPVEGVTVRLVCPRCLPGKTNRAGILALHDVPPGTYSVYFEKPGFIARTEKLLWVWAGLEASYDTIQIQHDPPQGPINVSHCE